MRKTNTYGKRAQRSKIVRAFAELPQSPMRKRISINLKEKLDPITAVADEVCPDAIVETPKVEKTGGLVKDAITVEPDSANHLEQQLQAIHITDHGIPEDLEPLESSFSNSQVEESLRILSWEDVSPAEDKIEKIAEASYAEVYRVSNDRGTSIIKVIRLHSPIKAQTKTQVLSKLVDELPHDEADVNGELQISQWLADIPGFVVYKERYVVEGKATKQLLETHQKFQKKLKRQDPGRAQFYPSPSRYLQNTRFLVVELGDAGIALENWKMTTESQLWDIFFLVAIALARAEDLAMFEHRDLHEGNLCIRQVRDAEDFPTNSSEGFYGYSGLDITILDYGLSRAEDLTIDYAKPVSHDLEKDLSIFTSTHAPQCDVYRQMRSFLLRADRKCLPPDKHTTAYAKGVNGKLSWEVYAPYTNVLWLAYLYYYLTHNFNGEKKALARFKKQTREMWKYLDSKAADNVPCFGSAADVVCFAVEARWITEEQLTGPSASIPQIDESIILSQDWKVDDGR